MSAKGKAEQAAKRAIAALSYTQLLEKQEQITSRIEEITIHEHDQTHQISGGHDERSSSSSKQGKGKGRGRGKNNTKLKKRNGTSSQITLEAEKIAASSADGPEIKGAYASASAAVVDEDENDETNRQNTKMSQNHDNGYTNTNTNINTNINNTIAKIPYNIKTEVHWDFLLMEMKWLSTDFQSERKRQTSLAKKQSSSIKSYTKTKEKRQLKRLIEIEMKKRKLGNKMARDVVKNWWQNKIERVIAYKQKVDSDLVKKRSMDKHLISLVKQTERYSDGLKKKNNQYYYSQSKNIHEYGSCSGHYYDDRDEIDQDHELTIEQALAVEDKDQTLKRRTRIRKRTQIYEGKQQFYNITIANNEEDSSIMNDNNDEAKNNDNDGKSGIIDESSTNNNDLAKAAEIEDEVENEEFQPTLGADLDDETTIEAEEKLGRDISYGDEISLLKKESEMSVEELRAMYYGITTTSTTTSDHNGSQNGGDTLTNKIDDTSSEMELSTASSNIDPFTINDEEKEAEFEPIEGADVDDETTIEAEEKLGRDMSYKDEISLLTKENEMSVEELKAMYYGDSTSSNDRNGECDQDEAHSDTTSLISNHGDILSDSNSIASNDIENDDNEFEPAEGNDIDDETTIEAEERLGRDMSYEDEIHLLNRENEMSVEELRAMYLNTHENDENYNSNHNIDGKRASSSDDNDDDESHITKRQRLDSEEGKTDEPTDDGEEAMRSLELADARARNTAVSRPFILAPWVKLREYQQIGLNWLVSIQTRRLNAILADEMGLGKTLQTISLLSYLACYKGIWGPHLIVVPTSCIVNWEMELKRFAPSLKVLCYYGSAKRRKELRQGWTKTNWHHVIITSYQLVVQDSFAFKRKKWYYLILDEAHNIKNFQSQRWQTLINFNTQRRLLLTGTPLQNNLMELWSLLHFLMPYIFRSRKEFSQWFSNPMNNIIEGNSNRNDDLIGRLHGIIRPFVLRRLKKDVETQMPGKFEHIVKCHLSRRQMFLYEEFMARSSTRMALQKGSNYMGMMTVLMQLRKVCNHPDLFEARSIITPFLSEQMSFHTAGCVATATALNSPLEKVSSNLMSPIWSLGCGLPSFTNSLKFDSLITARLNDLQPCQEEILSKFSGTSTQEPKGNKDMKSGLRRLLDSIVSNTMLEKEEIATTVARINSARCNNFNFPYPTNTLEAVTIEPKIPYERKYNDMSQFRIATTPKELIEMKKSQEERERNMDDMLKKYTFYVPKAGARTPKIFATKTDLGISSEGGPLHMRLSRDIESNYPNIKPPNTPFFPDKKLVQFDAGKLQMLAELLRSLKQGKHRVLIFTQMSKMLDILEIFLNLNGHTYLRLDGSTGVEQRQRLMDRFNNDEKMFCFILSTRSGGLGINLTGADTVVFYDSDWNPAMDAQAQDRAHRIGQTRDVHIYRLVTQHTIEENILVKAKQKRHLDFLVMDEGKFHAAPSTSLEIADSDKNENSEGDVTTKSGLRSILGLEEEDVQSQRVAENALIEKNDKEMSKEQIESAMATLEDEDDVLAMQGAQKEVAEELQEFDEGIQIKPENDADENGNESQDIQDKGDKKTKLNGTDKDAANTEVESEEAKLEKEFAEWQRQVGADKASIDASLNPVERYALRFREEIDPFYSMWYLSEQKKAEEVEGLDDEVNIEEIEGIKAEGERNAIEDGDLLATLPPTEDLPRQRNLYHREKARIRANKKRRKLTGENWCAKIDGRTKFPFWYNSDTGEAVWDKPKILIELHEEEVALDKRWNAIPIKPLISIMQFLIPYPDRMKCASICRQWRIAAQDISFVNHVYPVEMGALSMDPSKMDKNHFRTITEALLKAQPGDTIELGDGHYWLNDPKICVKHPIRIIGDEKDPSHVVVEVSGNIEWKASNGYLEGITFRRPRISTNVQDSPDMIKILGNSSLIMTHCVLEGSIRNKQAVLNCSTLHGHGILIKDNGKLTMIESRVSNNPGAGIVHGGKGEGGSKITLIRSSIKHNRGPGIIISKPNVLEMEDCGIIDNEGGSIQEEILKEKKVVKEEFELSKNAQ